MQKLLSTALPFHAFVTKYLDTLGHDAEAPIRIGVIAAFISVVAIPEGHAAIFTALGKHAARAYQDDANRGIQEIELICAAVTPHVQTLDQPKAAGFARIIRAGLDRVLAREPDVAPLLIEARRTLTALDARIRMFSPKPRRKDSPTDAITGPDRGYRRTRMNGSEIAGEGGY